MNWQLVENDEALNELLASHSGAAMVAIDTEFMRRNTFYPQPALLQLCFPGDTQAWLIDPLAIEDFSALEALFTDAGVVKVLHSPGEDLEVFDRLFGVQPVPLFDTQRAAAFLDMGHGLGYRALVESMSGLQLPKGETQSNWLQRPLTAAQLEYAAQDVLPVPDIYRQLRQQLEAADKLGWLLEDGRWAVSLAGGTGPAPVGRIKNAWKLDARQLALLLRVCDWREARARDSDKPRSWILSDNHCFQIAQGRPTSLDQLGAIEEFPAAVVRKQGAQLLQLVEEAQVLPEEELPRRLPQPLQAQQRDLLKKIKQTARQYAGEWKMAPELMLPAKDYELLVRKLSGEPIAEPELWRGWRRQRLLEPLLAEFRELE
jgi:ribonuclease D